MIILKVMLTLCLWSNGKNIIIVNWEVCTFFLIFCGYTLKDSFKNVFLLQILMVNQDKLQ